MTINSYNTERNKYSYLLQLANDQIQAIEGNDFYGFDRIVRAKQTITASLGDPARLMAADPTLATVIARIQECDKVAERLLYRHIGRLRREMNEIYMFRNARRAYGKAGVKPNPLIGFAIDADTPRYLDMKS